MDPIEINERGDTLVMTPGGVLERRATERTALPEGAVGSHRGCRRAVEEMARFYRREEGSERAVLVCVACGTRSEEFHSSASTYGELRAMLESALC